MRMARALLAVVLGLALAAPAFATAPDRSLRPEARPDGGAATFPGIQLLPTDPIPRPRLRPAGLGQGAAAPLVPQVTVPLASPRPPARTRGFIDRLRGRDRALRAGMVCGVPEIQGEVVGRVPGRIAGCGIPEAVRIREVSGVRLSQQSLMDCPTAQALNSWVVDGVKPALRREGQVVQLQVAAHYACRTRNHQPGARISEHGKGRAIDISGFRMADGRVITLTEHWTSRRYRRAMRSMHQSACGPFGTVLGPESDRFHQDHFHFDTARYRSGPYCR